MHDNIYIYLLYCVTQLHKTSYYNERITWLFYQGFLWIFRTYIYMYIIICKDNKFLNSGRIEAYENVYSFKTPVNNILIV